MGWIKQTPPPCKHSHRPILGSYVANKHIVGDIWECDDCKKRFIVSTEIREAGMQHDPYKETYLVWRDHSTTPTTGIYYPPGVR